MRLRRARCVVPPGPYVIVLGSDQRRALLTAVKSGDETAAASIVNANISDVNAQDEDG